MCQKKQKELGDLYDEIVQVEKPLDSEIEELFIDDSEIFESDDISEDDKKVILDLIDGTDFSFNSKMFDQDDDATTVDYNMDDATKITTTKTTTLAGIIAWKQYKRLKKMILWTQ